jgi:hypothetical protein
MRLWKRKMIATISPIPRAMPRTTGQGEGIGAQIISDPNMIL